MTAIDNLVTKADELNKDCLKNLGSTVEEIVDTWEMIQTLIDIALDLQDQMSRLIVTHIKFELPIEEEKVEIPQKSDIEPYPSQIHDHLINVGPINIYSMVEALSDNIREFITQTIGIASIFTNYTFFDASQSYSPKYGEMLSSASIKEPEKPASIIDKTHFIGTGTLYSKLRESALMIKEMETIHDRMAVIPNEKGNGSISKPSLSGLSFRESTSGEPVSILTSDIHVNVPSFGLPVSVPARTDIHEKVTDTYRQPGNEMENVAGLRIKDVVEFSGYVHDLYWMAENISTTIRTRITEARDVIDFSSLQKISMGALTTVNLDRTSTTVHTSTPKIHGAAGFSSIEDTATRTLHTADRSKSQPLHKITPLQHMIEVPDFLPVDKFPTDIEESAINAAALTDAIGREFGLEKEMLSYSSDVTTPSFAGVTMVLPSISASTVPVSDAFNTILDYFSIAFEIGEQMTDMVKYSGDEVSNIFTHSSPIHMMVAGEDTGAAISLNRTIFSGNDPAISMPGISQSMTMTASLIKEGTSAVNDVFLSLPPDKTGYGVPAVATMPSAMENVMQMFYGSKDKETPLSPTTRSTNHFHNTFNIVVNMKGAGDEHELRELGRKIGTILSDEIKRYGGVV